MAKRKARTDASAGSSAQPGAMRAKMTPSKKRGAYVSAPSRSIADSARCPKCGAHPGERHQHSDRR